MIPSIRTKIVGVTFQPIGNFQNLTIGQRLYLIGDPENVMDPYALRVERDDGTMLGYIGRKLGLNVELSLALRDGKDFLVEILDLTGRWKFTGTGMSPADTIALEEFQFGINIGISRIKVTS